MKPKRLAIILNKNAKQGKATLLWEKFHSRILKILPSDIIVVKSENPLLINELILDMIDTHEVDGFISAGGDGGVHTILNILMIQQKHSAKKYYLGGIGLGSSNDFLKPNFDSIASIPLKVNWNKNELADVGCVVFKNQKGSHITRYFIINASIGITAHANNYFNNPGFIVRFLKKHWTNAAIVITAIYSIFKFENLKVDINYNDKKRSIALSNLGVIKNPNISGNFKYEQNIARNDGYFGLNYCQEMNKLELIKTLIGLSKGKFTTNPKRITEKVRYLSIKSEKSIEIEMDGEVFSGSEFDFSIIPSAIFVMGNKLI